MQLFHKFFIVLITLSNIIWSVRGYSQAQIGLDDFQISNQGPALDGKFEAKQPNIVYNSTDSTYLVVWSGVSTATSGSQQKFEIFGQLLDSDGNKIGSDFQISSTLAENDLRLDAENPSIAYNTVDNNFLVVWDAPASFFAINSTAVNDQNEIFGQLLTSDGSEIGTDFRISDMGPPGQVDFDAQNPDVAYNPVQNNYLVVWSGDDARSQNEIYGQFISSNGAEIGTNDFRISDMGPDGDVNFAAVNPSISYNMHDNNFLVVWSGDDNTGDLVNGEQEIFGQLLTDAGLETGPNDFRISDMGPDGDGGFDALVPDVVFNALDTSFLVAWRGNDIVNEAFFTQEVYGQIVLPNGQETGPNDFLISSIFIEDLNRSLHKPSLTHDPIRNRFQVFYVGIASSEFDEFDIDVEEEIFGTEVSNDGLIVFAPFQLSSMGPDRNFDFSASLPGAAYGVSNQTTLVIWQGNDDSDQLLRGEDEIFGQLIGECVDSIISNSLTSPLPSGIFQVSNSISYSGLIGSASDVIFDAGQMTELEPGFEIQSGATLNVLTRGCE